MDKILIYTNSINELESYVEVYDTLQSEGYEVVFSTDFWEVAKIMAISFLTTVKFDTYYPDMIVTNEDIVADNKLTLEELKELINNE